MKTRIGNKLLVIREERKLSQQDMSEILGVSQSSYARIERNETSVDFEKIVSFANNLNVPVQELLPETLTITNNNHNSGNGGGIIFGNQYFFGTNQTGNTQDLNQRLELLKAEIKILEDILNQEK